MLLNADFFWRLFEATGSIRAYMMYRRMLVN
ncbi:YqzL family protein [Peptococcaceae bacterium]|nr:YqzL family protein [Peptococcaceae bacterium]